MRILVILAQIVLGFFLTPIVLSNGLLSLINVATSSNFNLRYQLHFIVGHFGTYVVALLLALVFWIVGRLLATVLGASRIPSLLNLLVTVALALVFAHLSQLGIVSAIDTAFYKTFYKALPPIVYPLFGAVLAALLVPGKRND